MIFLNLSAYLILPKPVSINMTTYVIYVEPDSPAQRAGLMAGDQISNPEVLKFLDNSSAIVNVTRKHVNFNIELYHPSEGQTGVHL